MNWQLVLVHYGTRNQTLQEKVVMTYNSTGLHVGSRTGTSERSEDSDGGTEMLEPICPSTSTVKEFPEDEHGGVSLPGTRPSRQNDGLGVVGLGLLSEGFLDHSLDRGRRLY